MRFEPFLIRDDPFFMRFEPFFMRFEPFLKCLSQHMQSIYCHNSVCVYSLLHKQCVSVITILGNEIKSLKKKSWREYSPPEPAGPTFFGQFWIIVSLSANIDYSWAPNGLRVQRRAEKNGSNGLKNGSFAMKNGSNREKNGSNGRSFGSNREKNGSPRFLSMVRILTVVAFLPRLRGDDSPRAQ